MADLDAVAGELKAHFDAGTWYEALIPHFAETIEVEHHPNRAETDGPTAGTVLAENMRGAHFGDLLRDARQELVSLDVAPDSITASQELRGILQNGTELRLPLKQKFTFADGKMVGLDHYTDPADTDALMEAFRQAAAKQAESE